MHEIECDVLVVGAGPAGSSAARAAAEVGASDSDYLSSKEYIILTTMLDLKFAVSVSQKWRIRHEIAEIVEGYSKNV